LYRKSHPEAPKVRIYGVPNLNDLNYEVTNELRLPSAAFDGFVVPPAFLGDMYQQRAGQALSVWTTQEDIETEQDDQYNNSLIDDLLPYYRYNVATYDGKIRGLPILSGSQAMILFRKDYLDALNLPTPKTWEHWTTLASAISNAEPPFLGDKGDSQQPVYGACLGLLSQAGCRKRKSLDNQPCNSQTMTYLGMMMATMTQYMGNSTGFMMAIDNTTKTGLDPLFQPTLTRILKWMEDQVKNSELRSLTQDSLESMNNFREGRCAWTISIDHDRELLKDNNIGFVPLPGSHQVLNRGVVSTIAESITKFNSRYNGGAPDVMINCTDTCDKNCQLLGTTTLCPYGEDVENWGRANHVPFGAVDATIGTVSGLISLSQQEQAKNFFKFVLASETGDNVSDHGRMRQPLTYSDLEKSDVQNYKNTLSTLTSNPNAAIPFRVPNAFNLLSDLDDRIYDYLLEGDYSEVRREEVAWSAEKSWQIMIPMHDARGRMRNNLPTSFFYNQSLGIHVPLPASDLYIGWTLRGIMWTLAGLSCLASFYFAILVRRHKRERVIRASQPVFLYLICGGTFTMALSAFAVGIEDDIASYRMNVFACCIRYWLYSMGFTAVIAALFTKIWMLGKAFRMPGNERLQITKWEILIPFMIIFAISFLVLLIWTITDGQEWVRVPVHNSDLYSLNIIEESTLGMCVSKHTDWDIAFLLAFNYAILVLALVQSYECRRITTEYAESAWVAIAITIFAQTWLIYLPLVMLVDQNPTTYFLLRSCAALFTSFTVLLLIFVPKIQYLYAELAESKKNETDGEESRNSSIKSDDDFTSGIISPQAINSRRKVPKGTLGIRIVQHTYLDSDQLDELQDAVDKAEQRNIMLRDTREKLKENLEERRYARKHRLSSVTTDSSMIGFGARFDSISEKFCDIVNAKPDRINSQPKLF